MSDVVAVWVNCPDVVTADRIAECLLGERLIACANRYPEIASRYVWRGRVETAVEVPLLLKTRRVLFERVAAAARALHPFETPAIWAVDVTEADADYADWVRGETVTSA